MSGYINFIKKALRPITVPLRRRIKFDRLLDVVSYVRGVKSAYEPFPGGLLKVENSSGGFLVRIIELALTSEIQGNWLLVSEPEEAGAQISQEWKEKYLVNLPKIESIESALNTKWNSQEFQYDLCIYPVLQNPPKYSVVMHQSLLEHVVDPVTVIRNLNDFLLPGGIQVIQTVNIYSSLHRYPIDTLRFFPDFFENLSNYLPVKCLNTFMENGSIYAVLQNTKAFDS
jgi:hypothetical protein